MHKKNAKCLGEIQDSDNLQCIPYLQKMARNELER